MPRHELTQSAANILRTMMAQNMKLIVHRKTGAAKLISNPKFANTFNVPPSMSVSEEIAAELSRPYEVYEVRECAEYYEAPLPDWKETEGPAAYRIYGPCQ